MAGWMYVRVAGWHFSLCSMKSHQRLLSGARHPAVVALDPGLHELSRPLRLKRSRKQEGALRRQAQNMIALQADARLGAATGFIDHDDFAALVKL